MAKSEARKLSLSKRVVIKLGSHVVTGSGYLLDRKLFKGLALDVRLLRERGVEVVIVTSGAVAAGMGRLKLSEPPSTIPEKQAIAAVGQIKLMRAYKEHMRHEGLGVGQILLTRDDFESRRRYQNAKNTINALLSMGLIPIINENDSVVVEEIKLGDNDNLSALVTNLIEADALLILSDVEGLFDKDPKANADAKLISRVDEVDEVTIGCASDSKTCIGTGGMTTKLLAAKQAVHGGAAAVIGSGKEANVVSRVFSDEEVGTYFPAMEDKLTRRKHWIAYTVNATGTLALDPGAVVALKEKGKSLLPKGVTAVTGTFDRGDAVELRGSDGQLIAKGLTNYSATEAAAIAGLATWEIVDKLGYKFFDEVIHRDDLVLL
jgi:glutamate 5-kinase